MSVVLRYNASFLASTVYMYQRWYYDLRVLLGVLLIGTVLVDALGQDELL